jgi:hypothetical protein
MELGPLKMELSVAVEDLKKVRTTQGTQQKEIARLTGELGKKSLVAQANLKKIVEIPRTYERCNSGRHTYGTIGMVRTSGGITGMVSRQGQPGSS